jgi:uncharacterized protein YecT (DUF1311 family)
MRNALSLGAGLAILAGSAFAGAQGDPERGCDGGTPEMVDCLNAKAAEWDKKMTIAYQQAMKEAQPKQREQLRAAQRLWIQYRDANCLYYGMGGGSIARIDVVECVRRMTESRARELGGDNAGPDSPGKENRD